MNHKKKNYNTPKCLNLVGMASYDEQHFMFAPDNDSKGQVTAYRHRGVGQQLSDGTFEFVIVPRLRPKSKLIKKLAHGRLSETKDGAVQLTLKIYHSEHLNISKTLLDEAWEAVSSDNF